MGGSSSPPPAPQQTVVQQQQLPAWVNYGGQENLAYATDIANNLPAPYLGNMVAPQNQNQLNAFQQVANYSNAAAPAINQGISTLGGLQNYNSQTVSPQSWTNTNTSAYQAPYGDTAGQINTGQYALANVANYYAPNVTAQVSNPYAYGAAAAPFGGAQTLSNAYTGGLNGLANGMGYNSQQVGTQGLNGADLSGYMNPYTSEVENNALANMDRSRQMSLNSLGADASSKGAFGGSRQGIAEGITNSETARAMGDLSSQLRQANYQNAQNMFNTDQARYLQAGMANQNADLQAAGLRNSAAQSYGALGMQGISTAMGQMNNDLNRVLTAEQGNQQQATQAAGLRMNAGNSLTQNALAGQQQAYNQFNADANRNLSAQTSNAQNDLAAATLRANSATAGAGLGQMLQNTGVQGGASLLSAGTDQQNYDQSLLNEQARVYDALRNYPLEQLGIRQSAMGMTPYATTSATSGPAAQTTSGNTGLQAAGMGLSLLGMFMSDEKTKTNIQELGKDPQSGLPMYAYDYKSDVANAEKNGTPMPPKRVGPMAQDIQKMDPNAIAELGGKKIVKNGSFGIGGGITPEMIARATKKKG